MIVLDFEPGRTPQRINDDLKLYNCPQLIAMFYDCKMTVSRSIVRCVRRRTAACSPRVSCSGVRQQSNSASATRQWSTPLAKKLAEAITVG